MHPQSIIITTQDATALASMFMGVMTAGSAWLISYLNRRRAYNEKITAELKADDAAQRANQAHVNQIVSEALPQIAPQLAAITTALTTPAPIADHKA